MPDRNSAMKIDSWLGGGLQATDRLPTVVGLAGHAVPKKCRIKLNGKYSKPSRIVRPDDRLRIRRGPHEWTVAFKNFAANCGPTAQAQRLDDETAECIDKRARTTAQVKLKRAPNITSVGRPSKKERGEIFQFKKRSW